MRKPITKVKDFIRDNKLLSISILLVFVILIYSMFSPFLCPVEDVVVPSSTGETYSSQTIGKIDSDTVLEQTFISTIAKLDSIYLTYSNYSDLIEEGHFIVEIYNSDDKLIYINQFELNELSNNQTIKLEFDRQNDSLNKIYTIVLSVEDLQENKEITFYAIDKEDNITISTDLEDVSGSLYITQHGEDYSYYYTVVLLVLYSILLFFAMYKYYKNNKIKFNKMRIILQFILSFIFAICVLDLAMDISYEGRISYISFPILILSITYIIRNITIFCNREKVERLFLMVAMPLSMLFLVCMIPQFVPDFKNHYSSIYQLIHGTLYFDAVDIEYLGYENINSYSQIKEWILDSGKDVNNIVNIAGCYNPFIYLVSAIGMFIANVIKLNFMQSIYLAEMFNLIMYLVVGFYAIKLMPNKKHLLMVYMLTPIYLQQATSLSCDAMINASCMLFISYIFHLKNSNEALKTKDIIILSVLSLLVLMCKYAYFPLLLLLFLIKDKIASLFKDIHINYKKVILIVLGILLCAILFWYYRIHPLLVGSSTSETLIINGILAPQTAYTKIQYLMLNPLKVVYIAIHTLRTYMDEYIFRGIGSALGKLDIIIPSAISAFYLIILILSAFVDNESTKLKKGEKRLITFIWLINVAIIFAAMYNGFGSTRNFTIGGVQGRYFIPINILLFSLINYKNIKYTGKAHKAILAFSIIFVNVLSIGYVIEYFL